MPTLDLYNNLHDSNNATGLAEQCVEILPVRLRKPLSVFIEKQLSQYDSDDKLQKELVDRIEDAVAAIPREEDICIHVAFVEYFEPALDVRYKQASLLPAVAELFTGYPLLFLKWFNRNGHRYDTKSNWENRQLISVIKYEVSDAIIKKYIFDSDDEQQCYKTWVASQLAAVVLAVLVQDLDNLLQKPESNEKKVFVELLKQIDRSDNMLEVIDFLFVSLKSTVDAYSHMDGSRVPANAGEVVSELEKNWLALKSSSSWQLCGSWNVQNGQ